MINNTKVKFAKRFRKNYQKSPQKVQKCFDKRLEIFIRGEHSPILNDHSLTGKFMGYKSININGDWRALYSTQIVDNKTIVIFEALGPHSQLYG